MHVRVWHEFLVLMTALLKSIVFDFFIAFVDVVGGRWTLAIDVVILEILVALVHLCRNNLNFLISTR